MDAPTVDRPDPCLAALDEAKAAVADRSVEYGPPLPSYERAASIASLILGKPFNAHDIAMILHSVKLSRIAETPDHRDSYVDGCAMLSFACEFVGAGQISSKRIARALAPEAGAIVPFDAEAGPPPPERTSILFRPKAPRG